jgi:hypothetical protein
MGEMLLGKVKIPNTELVKWSGAPTGLSEVRWTKTTVGGPNDLGGSITRSVSLAIHLGSEDRVLQTQAEKGSRLMGKVCDLYRGMKLIY